MRRIRLVVMSVTAVVLAGALVGTSGCSKTTGSKEIALTPSISSPAIGTDGVLKVGVDSTHAPFAGELDGELIGIDIDIAAALAEQLGLKLEMVDITGEVPDTLLVNGDVDVVMNLEQVAGTGTTSLEAGPYLYDGPSLFMVSPTETAPTVDLTALQGTKVAAQSGSLSAWQAQELVGDGNVVEASSLSDAFDMLVAGEVTYVAADSVVGSYLAMNYENVICVSMIQTSSGIYMGVSPTNTELSTALGTAFDTIQTNGILKVIASKWLGPLSAEIVLNSE